MVIKIKLIDRIKNFFKRPKNFIVSNNNDFFRFFDTSQTSNNEVTYFVCLKMLTEALAKMPLKLFKSTDDGVKKVTNKAYEIIKTRPNQFMTPSTFWTTIENNRNHYGNAYVWIRNKRKLLKYGMQQEVIDYWVLPSNNVTIVYDDKGIFENKGKLWYVYVDELTAKKYVFRQEEILHFKTSSTYNGIVGKPVCQILNEIIDTSLNSQSFMNNLYKNGLTANLGLQIASDLGKKETDQLVEYLKGYANGIQNVNGIFPVPPGTQLVPLNIKPTDAQFFELKKYNALQIASAFGIKPNQINNYEKSSYNSSEMQQLDFYVDTMLYIQKQYEEELNYKLLSSEEISQGFYFKFNEKVLLRSDTSGQMESIVKAVNNGIYTPNEARELLDLPKIDGGDVSIVNGNYINLTDVGKQYKTDNGGVEDE